ncbi:hypothetical protein HOY82DRAFT_556948 [Tuber indicum]|nr:hypothetical protein HOY82DRAFT_556948 [Tuber indicum]
MPTFDYASTGLARYLSDGSRADIIHYVIVTGPENIRISASDFPIRIAGADVANLEINSLENPSSGSTSGEPCANSKEETDPCLHDRVDSREADVGNEHSLGFRWYFLSNVPAERYLYWSSLPATCYIPKSCLVFRHQAEPITYQFDWGTMARGSVVYLCHDDGKVERLAPGDPIVAGLTFTSLGEPLDDVIGLDKPGLVTISPGCYQADLFIDRLMCMNGFGSEDGFDSPREEAIPLLLGMGSASKENISFYGINSLASLHHSNTDDSDLNSRQVHHSLGISMKKILKVSNRPSSQSTTHAMLKSGACDEPDDDELVAGTDEPLTARSLDENCATKRVGGNEIPKDRSIYTGGVGISVLNDSFIALPHSNPTHFAQAEEVMLLYPSVFSSGEQISIFNESGRREVCVESPDTSTRYSGQGTDWMDLPEGTFDPRAPPFAVPASKGGGRRFNQPRKPLDEGGDAWPPERLVEGFETTYSGFSDLDVFRARLGGVRNWCTFPPIQVAVEYLPAELKRLDWTGREGDKGGLPDPILLGRTSSPPIDEGARHGRSPDPNAGHW